MKFCKKYEEYMQGQQKKLPGVGIKKLKKILKKCSRDCRSLKGLNEAFGVRKCRDQCPVCDGSFFPSLLNGMTEVVDCFNERAQRLLKLHLATGFRKYFFWFKGKFHGKETVLVQEGKDLVIYALINAIAIRKILKKYDKIHYSRQGQLFKSQAQSKHMEILQSPWLCELMAFHINLRESKNKSMKKPPAFFDGCSLTFKDDKPSLTCEPFDSIKLDIDLTCSICLETVFDPVSLTCGHIFCYMCACSSASVTIVDGLKAANSNAKCPLCRVGGVYQGAVRLEELNILLGRRYGLTCFIVYIAFSIAFPWVGLAKVRKWITELNCRLLGGVARDGCKGYWEQRLQTERVERVKQIKAHWDSQCRAFVGV